MEELEAFVASSSSLRGSVSSSRVADGVREITVSGAPIRCRKGRSGTSSTTYYKSAGVLRPGTRQSECSILGDSRWATLHTD